MQRTHMTTLNGILELPKGNEGRIRQLDDRLVESGDDPFVPAEMAQKFALRQGQELTVSVGTRKPRRRRVVGDHAPGASGGRGDPRPSRASRRMSTSSCKAFDELTAIDPQPRLALEYPGCPPACRLIDLFCPIGYGTRGLIVAPPKAGKTILLQQIAAGIKHNHPDVEVIALLIDERPEEVTDFKRNVRRPGARLFQRSRRRDACLALGVLSIERAKRMLEAGHGCRRSARLPHPTRPRVQQLPQVRERAAAP